MYSDDTNIINNMDEYDLEHEARWLLKHIAGEVHEAQKSLLQSKFHDNSFYPDTLVSRVDNIETICRKLRKVCEYWNMLDNDQEASDIEFATKIECAAKPGDQLYKITYGIDDGDAESGPIMHTGVTYKYAGSPEEAMEIFESYPDDITEGYAGGYAELATPEEVENWTAWLQDRRNDVIEYVETKLDSLGVTEDRFQECLDECVDELEAIDSFAFDDIPDWLESDKSTYWMNDTSRELFESGYPDNVIEDVSSKYLEDTTIV